MNEFTPPSFTGISRDASAVLITPDGAEVPIQFKMELGNLCPRCKHTFTGCITHAQITPELISLYERSYPLNSDILHEVLFTVVGNMSNYNTHVICSNCFFIPHDDLPEMSSEMVPYDLPFAVINPNKDVYFEWIPRSD